MRKSPYLCVKTQFLPKFRPKENQGLCFFFSKCNDRPLWDVMYNSNLSLKKYTEASICA